MEAKPCKVSVVCTAYNHEPYLRQTLESFVTQRTSFPFEVLVSDDASTDGTAAIIREYAETLSGHRAALLSERRTSIPRGSASMTRCCTLTPGGSISPPARGTTAGPTRKSSSGRWIFWTPIRTTPPACTTASVR